MKDKRSFLIGSFDGLHVGHQYLIEKFKKESLARNLNSTVMTYSKHPMNIIKKNLENYFIDSDEKRVKRLSDQISTILCDFESIRLMGAKDFFTFLKSSYRDLDTIYVGHDSSYGVDKISSIEKLNSFDIDINFEQIKKFEKIDVSSTMLREYIREGKLEKFESLTGRKFEIQSIVIPGKQLGRTIGFPTANLYVDPKRLRLPNGVYLGKTRYENVEYQFVANIGLRPTIDNERQVTIEAHILDFDTDIYGKELNLEVFSKIRDIQKFSSKEELCSQINKDIICAKAFFNR